LPRGKTLNIILCVCKRLPADFLLKAPPAFQSSMCLSDTVASWTILASRTSPCLVRLVNSNRADHHNVNVAATGCKRAVARNMRSMLYVHDHRKEDEHSWQPRCALVPAEGKMSVYLADESICLRLEVGAYLYNKTPVTPKPMFKRVRIVDSVK
jgi:hypothetical protein